MSKESARRGTELPIISPEQLSREMPVFYSQRKVPRRVLFQERDLLNGSFISKNISSQRLFKFEIPKTHELLYEGTIYRSFMSFRRQKGYNLTDAQLREVCKDLPAIPARSKKNQPIKLYSEEKVASNLKKWRSQKREASALDPSIFATGYQLSETYNLPFGTVKRILQNETATVWKTTNHYRRREAGALLTAYLNEKRNDEGIYYREGKECVPLLYFHERFGLNYKLLRKQLQQAPGPSEEEGLTLYFLDEALQALDPYIEVPTVDLDSGFYNDETGTIWGPEATIAQELGISVEKLQSYYEGAKKRDIRAKTGILTTAYDLEELTQRATPYLSRPTKKELQERKEEIVYAKDLADEYSLTVSAVKTVLKPWSETVDLRGIVTSATVYRASEARKQLDIFLKKPEIDKDKNEYRDEGGDIYISQSEASRRLGILPKFIQRLDEHTGVTKLEARIGARPMTLYRLADLEAGKKNPPPRKESTREYSRTDWIPVIEEEAQSLVAAGIPLTREGLQDNQTFINRVGKFYRGGLMALQKKYDRASLPQTPEKEVKPKRERINLAGMTDKEKILYLDAYGKKLIADGLRLVATELQSEHSGYLRAMRNYPGGIAAQREKLGVGKTVKVSRQWKKMEDPVAVIRQEIQKIIDKKGDFTAEELSEKNLYIPVQDYWEGGYIQLRKDFGLKSKHLVEEPTDKVSLQNEVRDFIAEHGRFSTPLAYENGKEGLISRIATNYDGGITQIMKDIGQKPNRRKWTELDMKREAFKAADAKGKLTDSVLKDVPGLKMAVFRHYPGGLAALQEEYRNAHQ